MSDRPKTGCQTISLSDFATATVGNLLGGDDLIQRSRKHSIMRDAAYYILKRDSKACSGNFFIDEEVLTEEGILDLSSYAVNPTMKLAPDFLYKLLKYKLVNSKKII